VCAYHEQAYPLSSSGGVQRGSPPQADAEGLGGVPQIPFVPPHDWGPRGLKTDFSEDLQRIDEA
jgi:hypothetical protein